LFYSARPLVLLQWSSLVPCYGDHRALGLEDHLLRAAPQEQLADGGAAAQPDHDHVRVHVRSRGEDLVGGRLRRGRLPHLVLDP